MNFDHLGQNELLRYLRGEASEEQAELAHGHLAFCDSCALRLDTLQHIRTNFESSWSVLENSLERWAPAVLSPEAAPRNTFQVVLRALFDLTREIATIGTAPVTALADGISGLSASLEPYVAGVGSPEALEAERHRQAAAELAGTGPVGPALLELVQASSRLSGCAQLAEVRLDRAGQEIGRVIADSHHRSIHVIVWPNTEQVARPVSEDAHLQAALLAEDGTVLETRRLVPADGARYWIAEFESVDQTEVLVGIQFDPQ